MASTATSSGFEAHGPRATPTALVVLLGVAVWLPSLLGGYPLDDDHLARAVDAALTPRPLVHHLEPLSAYFGSHWWHGSFPSSDLYRPVTKLGIALVHAVLGRHLPADLHALPQHLANLCAHAWAVWLVARLVGLACRWRPAALAAAAVFGVHALKSEAISTIVGRAEILGFALGAQALLLVATATRRALVWRGPLAALLFFLAFGSKENALAWTLVAPLFAATIAPGARWRQAGIVLAAAAPSAALFLLLRHDVLASLPPPRPVTWSANPLAEVPALSRWPAATAILGYGLGKTLFPIRLAADHGPAMFAPLSGFTDVRTVASAAVLLACLAFGLASWRRRRLLFLAAVTFFGFSFLTSNLAFPIGTQFAERLFYAPSLGLALLVAWLGVATRHREGSAIAKVALVLWLGHNATYAFRRSFDWRDTHTIAAHDVAVRPQSAYLHLLASDARLERGDLEGARAHLERATELNPRLAGGWIGLGTAYHKLGRSSDCERAWRAGLDAARRWPLEASPPERALLHMNLGLLLGRSGRADEAFEHLLEAATLEPQSTLRENAFLGLVQELAGRGEKARVAAALSRLVSLELRVESRARLERLLQRAIR